MRALVVDDDRVLADLLAFTLRKEGFQVSQAFDGPGAMRKFEDEAPDIVILDVNLPPAVPKMDGFTVCRKIREKSDTPVILLTVREDEEDIVQGLKLGADDYVLKPFSPRQLTARVQAVLRRTGKPSVPAVRESGELSLDSSRREVQIRGGEPVSLTAMETRLLDTLILNSGQVLTYDDLIASVWGAGSGDRDMVRQLVRRLRTKIEPDPANPIYIESVPGLGYGLVKNQAD